MELIESLTQLSNRLSTLLPNIQTEEATKNALIMPLLQYLGYDVFNPLEVIPEHISDIGTKKGEKVDYAIQLNGKQIIIIECKPSTDDLSTHANQLLRYFGVSEARIGILTNGIEYKFYSDLEKPNKMDEKPFFEFSLRNIDARMVNELKKYSKHTFELSNILTTAEELKYKTQLKNTISKECESPSEDFVKCLVKKIYSGPLTQDRKEKFTNLTQIALKEWLNDKINDRLKTALDTTNQPETAAEPISITKSKEDNICTTEEEKEAFQIIRAILTSTIDPKRVHLKDAKTYCSILIDNNNRKPVCRLDFDRKQKQIIFIDKERNELKHPIEDPVDIFQHATLIIQYATEYI